MHIIRNITHQHIRHAYIMQALAASRNQASLHKVKATTGIGAGTPPLKPPVPAYGDRTKLRSTVVV
jgi:hypothetical protein